jgi:hypothetical protein
MTDDERELLWALTRWITEGGPAAFTALMAAKVDFMMAERKRHEVIEATEQAEC